MTEAIESSGITWGYAMECVTESEGRKLALRVQGRVDEATWQEFGSSLSAAVQEASDKELKRLMIDLSELAYMSSRGLRVLTVAKREADEAGIEIELSSPNDVMREILSISRYDKLFVVTERA